MIRWTTRLRRGAAAPAAAVVLVLAGLVGGWMPAHAKERPAAATPAPGRTTEAGPGFTIAPQPAWVERVEPPAVPAAPAALHVLLTDLQTRLEPGGTVSFVHHVRLINDASGLQRGGQIEIDFDPSYERLVLHKLTIVRGSQRIEKLAAARVKLLHRETQLERQILDGRKTASVVLDDVRVGDRVEWSFSLVGDNPVFNGRFVDVEWTQGSTGPKALWRLRLLAPEARTIHHRVHDPEVQVTSKVQAGWRETILQRTGLPQFRYDEWLPPAEYMRAQVEFSEFADWHEVAAWAEQLFNRSSRRSPAVDARTQALRDAAATPADRLRLALDFVQRDIRYFGTEFGANSHLPAEADRVLQQRFGDCKDKVALLVTLLRELGIAATPALVSANYREATAQRLPSPLAFDHAIVRVQLDGQDLWLDGTRNQQTGPATERQAVGLGAALLATAGTQALAPTPAWADVLAAETVDTLSFPKLAEEGTLVSESQVHGAQAETLREALAALPRADFDKAVVAEYGRFYPGMVATAAPEVVSLDEHNTVKLTLRYRTGPYWRYADQRLLVGDFALINLISPLRLPDQVPRTTPQRLSAGRWRHTVRYTFGEPVASQPSESRFTASDPAYELTVTTRTQPRDYTMEGELRMVGDTLAPGRWQAYRDKLVKTLPRLAGTVNVPTLAPEQADAVRRDVDAMLDSVRRGRTRLATRTQLDASVKLVVLQGQLDAGRLPTAARVEALTQKAIQLDHLGRPGEALAPLNEALGLDDGQASTHAAAAVNAFMRRSDADALRHAERALALAPNDTAPRYTRVWARYFAGDYPAARTELNEVLSDREEVERAYGPIWLYLVSRRLGEASPAVTVAGPSPRAGWPYPVWRWMRGEIDFDALLAAARDGGMPDKGRLCELYFFAGEKALLDGEPAKARGFLEKSLATGVVEFTEYAMAQRELDRLAGRAP